MIPDFFGRVRAEEGLDAEATSKLEVGPVVERITESVWNGFGPGLELITRGSVARDMAFRDSVCSHGAPLVVVVSEPEFGDIFPTLVMGDFVGRKMSMVIDDLLMLCRFMEEALRNFAQEERVSIEIGSGHGGRLENQEGDGQKKGNDFSKRTC